MTDFFGYLQTYVAHFSIAAPAKPANLQMTNWRKGLTSTITVRWDKPRTTVQGITDTSILKYYVAYTNLESKKRRQIPTFTAERAILRLSANSRYKIQVKAYKTFNNTSQLAGPWSDFLTLKANESGKCLARSTNLSKNCPRLIKSAGKSRAPHHVLLLVLRLIGRKDHVARVLTNQSLHVIFSANQVLNLEQSFMLWRT